MYRILFIFLISLILTNPNHAQVRVIKDIDYSLSRSETSELNIYMPKNGSQHDVVIFIHGGSWSSGKKDTYWWLGRNFAKKQVVSVIIDYPLAPNATFKEMAISCATAVKWVKDSIGSYGGNPERIFVMGHSAGGHLAELINADPQYFKQLKIANPIKGVILNDAFGLDMEEYLSKSPKDHYYIDFIRTFGVDPKNWQMGSPLFYRDNILNPHLILYGTATHGAIQLQSEKIYKLLSENKVPVRLVKIEGKKHVPMISQLIWARNKVYDDIINFLSLSR